jgi:hypothetical protein
MKWAISNLRGQQSGGLAHFSDVAGQVTIIASVIRFFFKVFMSG